MTDLNRIFTIFIFGVFIIACKKDSINYISNNVYIDKIVQRYDSINLVGHLDNSKHIEDLYFLYNNTPDLDESWKSLNSIQVQSDNYFNCKISRYTLSTNTIYYFKACLVSNNHKYYSESISFNTDLYEVTIDSILPKAGVIGDTLRIFGKNFGTKSLNYVSIGNLKVYPQTDPVIYSDSIISFPIPKDLKSTISNIGVSINNNLINSNCQFIHSIPKIIDFTPKYLNDNSILTIKGNNFSKVNSYNKIKLRDEELTVVESSADQLKIQIPYDLSISGKVKVNLSIAMNNISSSEYIELAGARIDSVSTKTIIGGKPILVRGIDFGSSVNNIVAHFGKETLEVDMVNDTILKLIIPYNTSPGHNEIKLTIKDRTCFSNDSIHVTFPWIETDYSHPTFYRDKATGFVIDNIIFIGTGKTLNTSGYKLNNDLWKFNLQNGDWIGCELLPSDKRQRAVSFQVGGKGFIGLGDYDASPYSDLWEYNPETNAWRQMADFPGAKKTYAYSQVISDKVYIGFNFTDEFWEFDPLLNLWTQKQPLPNNCTSIKGSFTIDEYGYFLMEEGSGKTRGTFWKYNPSNDSWERKSDFPGEERYYGVGFSIGNTGFFGLMDRNMGLDYRDIWEYVPNEDRWYRLPDIPVESGYYTLPFVVEDNAYILFGVDRYSIGKLWKFSPF